MAQEAHVDDELVGLLRVVRGVACFFFFLMMMMERGRRKKRQLLDGGTSSSFLFFFFLRTCQLFWKISSGL